MSGDYELMTSRPPEAYYPMELFQWYLSGVQIWCFKLLRDWRYIDFQTSHFADFEQVKVDIYFVNFGQVKIEPILSLLLSLDRSSYFTSLGKACRKKWFKPSPFDKNSRTTRIRSGISHFKWCNQQESRTGFFSQWVGFKGSVFCFFL